MLDFEEELKNFKPSKEIDETADTINKRNKTDKRPPSALTYIVHTADTYSESRHKIDQREQ